MYFLIFNLNLVYQDKGVDFFKTFDSTAFDPHLKKLLLIVSVLNKCNGFKHWLNDRTQGIHAQREVSLNEILLCL